MEKCAELVNITPQVSGRIVKLDVRDNQFVHKGSALLTIENEPFRIAVVNSEAQVDSHSF